MTTAESPETSRRVAPPSALARCLRIAAGVLVLLVLSEAVWLWQTWPVRELLQPARPTHLQPAAR